MNIIISVILLILIVGSCSNGNFNTVETLSNDETSVKSTTVASKQDDLELVGGIEATTTETPSFGGKKIKGKVKNNSNKKYEAVKIEFSIYDSQGARIDSAVDYVRNFEPGEIWNFEALTLTDNCFNYKLAELSGF